MSINKRILKNGNYVYDLRYRSSKGRQFKKTFTTKREAQQYEASLRLEQSNGTWIDPRSSKITLEIYSIQWLKSKVGLRLRTRELYFGLLKHHIIPHIGYCELGELSTSLVRTWYADLMEKGLAQSTVAKAYRLVRTILNTAVEDSLIKSNPCSIKGAGLGKSQERPVASLEEVFALAKSIDERYRVAVILATFAGLRLGEILGLERKSIDIKSGTVKITQQMQELSNGRYYLALPKSEAGSRTIALPDFVINEIVDHLANFVAGDDSSLLFTGGNGAPLRRGVLFKAWKKARTEVGVEYLHFHDLRHTGNTLAAMTGASTKELMARMGHSSSEAALRYQHATRDRDIAIASKLNLMAKGYLENTLNQPFSNQSH